MSLMLIKKQKTESLITARLVKKLPEIGYLRDSIERLLEGTTL
jgi:DNA-directed RNA polymerase specialized sigma54-like protein